MWARRAVWEGPVLSCLLPHAGGLLVGTHEAHLLELSGDTLVALPSFEAVPEREAWYTPWGGPPDTRSLAADGEAVLANVHVGGVLASDDLARWQALVDIDVDVHQIVVAPDHSLV